MGARGLPLKITAEISAAATPSAPPDGGKLIILPLPENREDYVVARSEANCGNYVVDWKRCRLRVGPMWRSVKQVQCPVHLTWSGRRS